MISISAFISLIYSSLILTFVKGFGRIKMFSTCNIDAKLNFSIIIPFRNESENLPDLLKSLSKLDYPKKKFEILLINDDSTDDFNSIIDEFRTNHIDIDLRLLNNIRKSNSPKKDAIEMAIQYSKFPWIVTTDADCIVPKNWLRLFDQFISKTSPKMIVAPVAYDIQHNFLEQFQNLEFLSLQGSTIGSFGINHPFLCNGANLCYNKNAFIEVKGFKGNENIASGDDIFLLEKMTNKFPKQVKYLKSTNTIVTTKPEVSISGMIEQRIRWASKTGSYKNKFAKVVGSIVLITNVFLILLLILAVINTISWQHFGLFFLIKFNVDFILIYKTSKFFKHQDSLKTYLFSSFLYPFFTIYVTLLSFKKTYQWKGRTFN